MRAPPDEHWARVSYGTPGGADRRDKRRPASYAGGAAGGRTSTEGSCVRQLESALVRRTPQGDAGGLDLTAERVSVVLGSANQVLERSHNLSVGGDSWLGTGEGSDGVGKRRREERSEDDDERE